MCADFPNWLEGEGGNSQASPGSPLEVLRKIAEADSYTAVREATEGNGKDFQ